MNFAREKFCAKMAENQQAESRTPIEDTSEWKRIAYLLDNEFEKQKFEQIGKLQRLKQQKKNQVQAKYEVVEALVYQNKYVDRQIKKVMNERKAWQQNKKLQGLRRRMKNQRQAIYQATRAMEHRIKSTEKLIREAEENIEANSNLGRHVNFDSFFEPDDGD